VIQLVPAAPGPFHIPGRLTGIEADLVAALPESPGIMLQSLNSTYLCYQEIRTLPEFLDDVARRILGWLRLRL
jgi:hypothetical protein